MNFNKTILLTAALLLGGVAKAQQIPLYSNYFFTPYIYNPSLSGTEGSTKLSLLHRRQWTGIQGSPETSAFAIDGSLNEEKVGWSVYGFSDKTDILQRLGIYGNYAYHVQLSDNSQLSFGLGAGYLNNAIDVNGIRARQEGDVFDITNGNRGTFDLNAGLSFKIADFTLGAAAPQLLGQAIEYAETPTRQVSYSMLRHYVFNAQYDFKFDGERRVLTPLVMVRAAENVPIQVDAGVMFQLEEYGHIGAMYRSDYAVTGNLGINLTEQLTVGYAYDFSLNKYSGSLGTSHEFMLSYKFGSDKRNERLENEIKRLKERQRRAQDQTEELVDEKLEEFKDEYKRELQEEMKKAADEAAQEAAKQAAQQAQDGSGGNTSGMVDQRRQNTGTGNNNQANQNQGQPVDNSGQAGTPVNRGGAVDQGQLPSQISAGAPGYYLIAGVFSNKANADRRLRQLSQEGIEAGVFQDPGNYFYYVFIRRYNSYQAADNAKASNLNGRYNGELWIKVVK